METWWKSISFHIKCRLLNINIIVGSIPREMINDIFFNDSTRRMIQVTPEGLDYAMSLTENIEIRKNLLISSGIISNPFHLKD